MCIRDSSATALPVKAIIGSVREVSFLYQRISVVVKRFNAVFLHNSFVQDDQPEKVPFL